jgi:hypothetical protein
VNYIFNNYDIDKLYVEVEDKEWFNKWVLDNKKYLTCLYDKIKFVEK